MGDEEANNPAINRLNELLRYSNTAKANEHINKK
jgi:hypothetical protein